MVVRRDQRMFLIKTREFMRIEIPIEPLRMYPYALNNVQMRWMNINQAYFTDPLFDLINSMKTRTQQLTLNR